MKTKTCPCNKCSLLHEKKKKKKKQMFDFLLAICGCIFFGTLDSPFELHKREVHTTEFTQVYAPRHKALSQQTLQVTWLRERCA